MKLSLSDLGLIGDILTDQFGFEALDVAKAVRAQMMKESEAGVEDDENSQLIKKETNLIDVGRSS